MASRTSVETSDMEYCHMLATGSQGGAALWEEKQVVVSSYPKAAVQTKRVLTFVFQFLSCF